MNKARSLNQLVQTWFRYQPTLWKDWQANQMQDRLFIYSFINVFFFYSSINIRLNAINLGQDSFIAVIL